MIPMSLKSAVKAYVEPHLTKETKAPASASFNFEDGTLTYTLEPPIDKGIPVPVDLNDSAAVVACRVTRIRQGVKNPNVTIAQSFTKLSGAETGFQKLYEHANTLAEVVS